MGYYNAKLNGLYEYLEKISNIMKSMEDDGDSASASYLNEIETVLGDVYSNMQEKLGDIEDMPSYDEGLDERLELPTSTQGFVWGKGETCLLLNPFDNYKVFTLMKDYKSRTPFDLSDGQKLYLVFRSYGKELRIPECTETDAFVDKVNGQVLFKITKKQSSDIISSFTSRTFYITRVYDIYNPSTDTYDQSDEEELYSGKWGIGDEEKVSQYVSLIESMSQQLADKEVLVEGLESELAQYASMYATDSEEYLKLKAAYDELDSNYTELCNKIEELAPGFVEAVNGDTNIGELIDSKSILVNYANSNQETIDYYDNLAEDLRKDLENTLQT